MQPHLNINDTSDEPQGMSTDSSQPDAAAAALEDDRKSRYGFLYLGFRPEYFTYALRLFAVSLWMACVTVFLSDSSQLQVFLAGLVNFLQMVSVAVERPYEGWQTNFFKVLAALATVAHAVFMLGLETQYVFFSILLALFLGGSVVVAVKHRRASQKATRVYMASNEKVVEDAWTDSTLQIETAAPEMGVSQPEVFPLDAPPAEPEAAALPSEELHSVDVSTASSTAEQPRLPPTSPDVAASPSIVEVSHDQPYVTVSTESIRPLATEAPRRIRLPQLQQVPGLPTAILSAKPLIQPLQSSASDIRPHSQNNM